LADCIDELGHVSVHMMKQIRNEWTSGYHDTWMNEDDNSRFELLMNVNYFHVDVHEKSHHELNGLLEKKSVFNVKTTRYPK
jgi:hypothetical protein